MWLNILIVHEFSLDQRLLRRLVQGHSPSCIRDQQSALCCHQLHQSTELKRLFDVAHPLTLKSLSFRNSAASVLWLPLCVRIAFLDQKKRIWSCQGRQVPIVVHRRQVDKWDLVLLLLLFHYCSSFIIIVISLLLLCIWGTHSEHASYLHLTEREHLKKSLRVFEITKLRKITQLAHITPLGFLYACWQG